MLSVFPKPVEITYSVPHSESAVLESLGEIVSFKGDHFVFPVRIVGNHLVVKRKWVVGTGWVSSQENKILVHATLRPSAEIKAATIFSLLGTALMVIAGAALLLKNQPLSSFAVFIGAALFFSFPHGLFSIAVQMQRDAFDSAILQGKRP